MQQFPLGTKSIRPVHTWVFRVRCRFQLVAVRKRNDGESRPTTQRRTPPLSFFREEIKSGEPSTFREACINRNRLDSKDPCVYNEG